MLDVISNRDCGGEKSTDDSQGTPDQLLKIIAQLRQCAELRKIQAHKHGTPLSLEERQAEEQRTTNAREEERRMIEEKRHQRATKELLEKNKLTAGKSDEDSSEEEKPSKEIPLRRSLRSIYSPQSTTDEERAYNRFYEQHASQYKRFLQAYLSDTAIQSKNASYIFFYEKEEHPPLPTTVVETLKYDEVQDIERRSKYAFSYSTSKIGEEKLLYDYWILFGHNQVHEYLMYSKA